MSPDHSAGMTLTALCLVLVIYTVAGAPSEGHCPEPDAPEHGSITSCDTQVGGNCSYACSDGYIMDVGHSTQVCQRYGVRLDGAWVGQKPRCTPCPENTYKSGNRNCASCPENSITNGRIAQMREGCECKVGFLGVLCEDMDECATNEGRGPCEEKCENSPGSYHCRCRSGYSVNPDNPHECQLKHSCEDSDELIRPENGDLDCDYNADTNSHYCKISCDDGYFYAARGVDYLRCGQETAFVWSHKLYDHTGILPACAEEFYINTQLPFSFAYESSQTCVDLNRQKENILGHISNAIGILRQCRRRCRTINMDTHCTDSEDTPSRLTINLDVLLINLPHPASSDGCDYACQRLHIMDMLEATKKLEVAIHDAFQNNSGALVPRDVISAGYLDKSTLEIGSKPLLLCKKPGYVLKDYRVCVPCAAGSFLAHRDDEYCTPCPVGRYQALEAQQACTKCPQGNTTLEEGATDPAMCDQVVSVDEHTDIQ